MQLHVYSLFFFFFWEGEGGLKKMPIANFKILACKNLWKFVCEALHKTYMMDQGNVVSENTSDCLD